MPIPVKTTLPVLTESVAGLQHSRECGASLTHHPARRAIVVPLLQRQRIFNTGRLLKLLYRRLAGHSTFEACAESVHTCRVDFYCYER